jgi:RNA polymerase sigma-70 factor (ECF subfamily)
MLVTQTDILEPSNQLIQDCIAGNRLSQNQLYQLFAPKMFAVCLRYSKKREEAEEILQEGFIQVFKSLKNFRHEGSFEGWMRKIMVNCTLARYRNKIHLSPVVELDYGVHDVTSTPDIVSEICAKELLALVQTLPAAYRLVFNLHVFEGYKHREIAEALGISEGTSKSNLFDARAYLQKALTAKKKLIHYK